MLAAGLSLLAACSSGGEAGNSDSTVARVTVATVASTSTAAATEAPPTTVVVTTVAVDGATALQAALDALGAGYHFTTTVTVDGAVAVTADGDHVGDGSRLTVTGSGAMVAYVITPAGTWVQPEDGDWQVLETAPANADPVAALRSPMAVSVDAGDPTTTQLTATVPAVALGIPGSADATAVVQLTLTGDALTRMTYTSSVDGRTAVVEAVLGPIVDATPVVSPV